MNITISTRSSVSGNNSNNNNNMIAGADVAAVGPALLFQGRRKMVMTTTKTAAVVVRARFLVPLLAGVVVILLSSCGTRMGGPGMRVVHAFPILRPLGTSAAAAAAAAFLHHPQPQPQFGSSSQRQLCTTMIHTNHAGRRPSSTRILHSSALNAVEPKISSVESELDDDTTNSNKADKSTNKDPFVVSRTKENDEDDNDDDEYEYIEYEVLTDAEFVGSEWLVGTNWDAAQNRIDETWVRLAVDQDLKQVAIWGDGGKGFWKLDVASQFLSISKESVLWGKNIWACTVDDYYYLQGTVRGWKYWLPAAVVGQWQAKRLGLNDPSEAGTPPWFAENNQPTDDTEPRKGS